MALQITPPLPYPTTQRRSGQKNTTPKNVARPRFGYPLHEKTWCRGVKTFTDFGAEGAANLIPEVVGSIALFVQRHKEPIISALPELIWEDAYPGKATDNPWFAPPVTDIPLGNVDYAARDVYRDATVHVHMLDHERKPLPNRQIFIHVVDPDVGKKNNRAVIKTNDGIFIGPDNGTPELIARHLKEYEWHLLDPKKVERFLQLLPAAFTEQMDQTFHGKDLFAVVAGAMIGGISYKSFVVDGPAKKDNLRQSSYSRSITTIDMADLDAGEPLNTRAIIDKTGGNLVTSLALSPELMAHLDKHNSDSGIMVTIERPNQQARRLEAPLRRTFGNVRPGRAVAYPGSTRHPETGQPFLELAINRGNIAKRMGFKNNHKAAPLKILLDRDIWTSNPQHADHPVNILR